MARTTEDALVAGFYARVVQRVCADFCERDPSANAAVAALLAEKWRERIECYTGVPVAPDALEPDVADRPASERASGDAEAAGSATQRQSASAANHIAPPGSGSRHPQSVFAAMLGGKRGISQVDGAQAANEEEEKADSDEAPATDRAAASRALTTPSREVAAVLNPVWGFAVSDFPMQLSALHTKFEYRRRRHDFYGKLSAIVLTLTRPLRPREPVRAGHLVWLSDERAFPAESKGGAVEVLRASCEGSDAVVVKLPGGASATVARPQLCRFYECIVKKGVVWVKREERSLRYTAHPRPQFPVTAMGITLLDSGCSAAAIDADKVACEGLLQYESKPGVWKERWFVLDSQRGALVKCAAANRQRSRSHGSALGGDVFIKDAQPLSRPLAESERGSAARGSGLDIMTQKGAQVRFRTKSVVEEERWLAAVSRLSSGFAAGVGERLAERELLAGRYSLVRELGRGASGIVSLYTWQGRPFAIKKFMPQKAKGIPNRRVAPGAGLHQPGARGGGPSSIPDDRKCYVSSKQSKAVRLLDEATVRRYTTQLVLGVQALHNNRLCHRDIKPENLMASEDRSTCKIGDLGVAHYFREENGVLRDEVDVSEIELWSVDTHDGAATAGGAAPAEPSATATTTTHTGATQPRTGLVKSTKGTYQFLPPEALSGGAFCGFKADVWSIGVTLYALSFGFLPFYSNDLVKLFERIESDPLVFPTSCLDGDLKDLLGTLLDKNPETRVTLEGILKHRWVHRNVNSKALQSEVRALKRSASLTVADLDLGCAVSVLQRRFNAASRALHCDDSVDAVNDASVAGATGLESAEAPVSDLQQQQQYVPRPISVAADAALPKWFHRDTELLAAQLHYDWCHSKFVAGWSYGAVRDDAARVHPCLLPMRSLADEEQDKNIQCVVATMRCVVALGCEVTQSKQRQAARREPLPTEGVALSWEMMMLVDLLAENSHELWAAGRVASGWTHGASFDADAKHHPSIKPYMELDEAEKELSRQAVSSVLKACLCLGYRISCSRRQRLTESQHFLARLHK
ncbi:hypothetical protein PybrP1_001215 [[Pythium] brassicae (nom. inval.)]|nr:hypothetical protein PybrP1_001215 [[Pythium] brassicae (nom. inval.)]